MAEICTPPVRCSRPFIFLFLTPFRQNNLAIFLRILGGSFANPTHRPNSPAPLFLSTLSHPAWRLGLLVLGRKLILAPAHGFRGYGAFDRECR